MKANAVVFTAPNAVEYQEVDCPDPGPGQVVVRVTHSWISNGTEGSFLRGERIDGDTAYRKGDPFPFPIIAGYQKIGVVEWVGDQIEDLEVGETVFSTMGAVNGMFKPRGGQVSPSIGGRDGVWKLPSGIDPLAFSGMVLTQVGFNCGARPPISPGEGAVVIGDGLVGHWAAQTLAGRGAEVVLVGRHEDRLAKFNTGPRAYTINAKKVNWQDAVRDILPDGAQVGVDAVGSVAAMTDLMDMMKRFGHLVSAGFYGTQDTMPLQPPRHKELSINLVSGWWPDRMANTLDLIAKGHLDTLSLITHHFPVRQAAEAWGLIESKREPVLGVILDWAS
jgi:3-hydroxyethyl bacteriochlorophyllide a dehydrogenase